MHHNHHTKLLNSFEGKFKDEAASVHMQTLEAEAHAPQSSHQITELL